jgi:hypothetical protein
LVEIYKEGTRGCYLRGKLEKKERVTNVLVEKDKRMNGCLVSKRKTEGNRKGECCLRGKLDKK